MVFNSVENASYDEVRRFHFNSDVDESPLAYHHTLGTLANQAAAGDHTHDGKNSLRIKFSDIQDGWFNLDGGRADTIYGGVPIIDGGSI